MCISNSIYILISELRYWWLEKSPFYIKQVGYNFRYNRYPWNVIKMLFVDGNKELYLFWVFVGMSGSLKHPIQHVRKYDIGTSTCKVRISEIWRFYRFAKKCEGESYFKLFGITILKFKGRVK